MENEKIENVEQIKSTQTTYEKDKYGNVVIDGVTYYSKESQEYFNQSLQEKNKELQSQIKTLNDNLNQLQSQINDTNRENILNSLGIKQEQIANVKKITQDIPNDKLADYIKNDRSLDIFRNSVFTEQPQQQQTETKKPKNKVLDWFNSNTNMLGVK